MRIYTFTTILSVLAVSSVYAELASTGYTDAGDAVVLNKIGTRDAQTGNWDTNVGDGTTIVGAINAIKAKIGNIPANSSIAAQIATKVDSNLGDANRAVTTSGSGALQSSALLTGSQIANNTLTNANFAGGLDMAKIDMPDNCTGQCMLVYKTNEQKYVWEELTDAAAAPSLSADYCVNTYTYGYQNDSRGARGAFSSDCTGCNDNEWHADFSYGTVTGIASCNSTAGDNQDYTWTNPTTASSDSMSSSSIGQYCWCKMTGFNGQSLSVASWVFYADYDDADGCAFGCGSICGSDVGGVPVFRGAVFRSAGVTNTGAATCN